MLEVLENNFLFGLVIFSVWKLENTTANIHQQANGYKRNVFVLFFLREWLDLTKQWNYRIRTLWRQRWRHWRHFQHVALSVVSGGEYWNVTVLWYSPLDTSLIALCGHPRTNVRSERKISPDVLRILDVTKHRYSVSYGYQIKAYDPIIAGRSYVISKIRPSIFFHFFL